MMFQIGDLDTDKPASGRTLRLEEVGVGAITIGRVALGNPMIIIRRALRDKLHKQ